MPTAKNAIVKIENTEQYPVRVSLCEYSTDEETGRNKSTKHFVTFIPAGVELEGKDLGPGVTPIKAEDWDRLKDDERVKKRLAQRTLRVL